MMALHRVQDRRGDGAQMVLDGEPGSRDALSSLRTLRSPAYILEFWGVPSSPSHLVMYVL